MYGQTPTDTSQRAKGRMTEKGDASIGADLEGSFFSFEETCLVFTSQRAKGRMAEKGDARIGADLEGSFFSF